MKNIFSNLNELKSFNLPYREKLDVSKLATFGLELEYQIPYNCIINSNIKKYPNWNLVNENTLINGHEIVSPVLKDELTTWNELKEICTLLKNNKVDITKGGGHVHIGSSLLGNNILVWKNFLKLYTIYEDILIYYGFGNFKEPRKSLLFYAKPIAKNLSYQMKYINKAKNLTELCYTLSYKDKFNALNFSNTMFFDILNAKDKNTIEFRFPNASDDEYIWQNNVNTFLKMLLKSKSLDSNYLDYLLNYYDFSKNDNYLYSNVAKALEFCDLIFDNDLDKLYFLKQYFKISFRGTELRK